MSPATSDVIAEVIESSTSGFEAEVRRTAECPAFGDWVRVPATDGSETYGVVCHVAMAPYDKGRSARALGMTESELRREMPQVLELLRTTFRVRIVAHRGAAGVLRQTLPGHPPRMHDFVYACIEETVRALGRPYDFLRTLVADGDWPTDELIVAVLSKIKKTHGGVDELLAAGRALSRLLRDDHERLRSILRRVA